MNQVGAVYEANYGNCVELWGSMPNSSEASADRLPGGSCDDGGSGASASAHATGWTGNEMSWTVTITGLPVTSGHDVEGGSYTFDVRFIQDDPTHFRVIRDGVAPGKCTKQ